MHQTTVFHPGTGKPKKVFHAKVAKTEEPALINRIKTIIEGTEYYFGKDGKLYVADLFDKMFGVQRSPMNLNQKKDELGMLSLNQF